MENDFIFCRLLLLLAAVVPQSQLKQRLSNRRMPICIEFKMHQMRSDKININLYHHTFMCFIVVLYIRLVIVGRLPV